MEPAEIKLITALLIPLTLAENSPLIHLGERIEGLYLIARGVLRIERDNVGGGEVSGILLAGESFGEKSLFCSGADGAGVTTLSPCRLYLLNRRRFERLLKGEPQLLARLTQRESLLTARFLHDQKAAPN